MNTISDLPRLAACPGSAALPQARTAGAYADRGHTRHAIAESAVLEGRLEALPVEIRALLPKGSHVGTEVSVAYNWETDTARLLDVRDRNYGAAQLLPTEIPGTVDLFVWRGDEGNLTVLDYKGFEDVGEPGKNPQLLGYALALARILGVDEVTVVVAYLKEPSAGEDPERDDEDDDDSDDDGPELELVRPLEVSTLDAFDLDAFAARVREIVAAIDEQRSRAVPDVRESRACKYCPAMQGGQCPAKTALIRQLATGAETIDLASPLTLEAAAIAFDRIERAEQLLKRAKAQVYAIGSRTPIPLLDGRVLGPAPGRETIDGVIAKAVLVERYGAQVAELALKPKTAKKWIREAIKTAAGVTAIGAAEEATLAEIRKRGGLKSTTKVRVQAAPKKRAEAKGAA